MWRNTGGIAQLVEHLLCKQGVIGSIPFASTKIQAAWKWNKNKIKKLLKRFKFKKFNFLFLIIFVF